jgi:hypothetical protein
VKHQPPPRTLSEFLQRSAENEIFSGLIICLSVWSGQDTWNALGIAVQKKKGFGGSIDDLHCVCGFVVLPIACRSRKPRV